MSVYKLWNEFRDHFPKKSRFTLAKKVDENFLGTLELILMASYLSKQEKLPYLQKSSLKLDLLKFFLQICWEVKALDSKKYSIVSKHLNELGKMLGGWIRQLEKTSAK